MNVDFKGKDKSWCRGFDIDAPNEKDALSKIYLQLHDSMHCTFRVWSCVELVDNPKIQEVQNELL